MTAGRARVLVACVGLALAGCITTGPPRHTERRPIAVASLARDGAAVLVLVYPHADWVRPRPSTNTGLRGPPVSVHVQDWMDVVDETGGVLARLPPGGWTALRRPTGRQRIYAAAVDEASVLIGNPRRVGVVDAELEAGRFYYVAIDVHQPSACAGITVAQATVDLSAVPASGPLLDRVRETIAAEDPYAPAPRGVVHPNAADLVRLGEARSTRDRCSPPATPFLEPAMGRVIPIARSR